MTGGPPIPKLEKRQKCSLYLKWLKSEMRTCVICDRGTTELHHHGSRGMATKVHDFQAVAMCHGCHMEFHAGGFSAVAHVGESKRDFNQRMWVRICSMMMAFVTQAGGGAVQMRDGKEPLPALADSMRHFIAGEMVRSDDSDILDKTGRARG